MKLGRSGQTAVEYLITTSFLLVVTGIIFAYAIFIYTDSTTTSTAKSAVTTIVNTVDQVQALGPENVLYSNVEIPGNVNDILFEDNADKTVTALVMQVQTSGGLSDIAKSAKGTFEVDSTAICMLKKQGRYKIRVDWLSPKIGVCVDDGFGNCQDSC